MYIRILSLLAIMLTSFTRLDESQNRPSFARLPAQGLLKILPQELSIPLGTYEYVLCSRCVTNKEFKFLDCTREHIPITEQLVSTMMNSFPSSQEASGERTHLLPLSESSRTDLDVLRSRESNNYELMRARRLLYLSHLFNQFSENAWQFCLVLFLAAFSNFKSLLLICTYGIVSGLCVCYFGSTTGRFIDGSNRLLVARRFIGAENFAVLLATSFCYILLSRQRGDPLDDKNDTRWPSSQGVPNDPVSILLLIGIHILGAAAKILDSGFVVAIERDWIVVMSRFLVFESQSSDEVSQRQKKWLSQTNVAMKQIDLSCKVAAPAFAGFFVALLDDGSDPHHGSDLRGAALFVGVLNALALVVEYFCTAKIYQKIPDLAIKSIYTESSIKSDARHEKEQEKKSNALMIYLKQPVAFAGIGLSLL